MCLLWLLLFFYYIAVVVDKLGVENTFFGRSVLLDGFHHDAALDKTVVQSFPVVHAATKEIHNSRDVSTQALRSWIFLVQIIYR